MAHSNHSIESSETRFKNHRPPIVKKVSKKTIKIYVWELPVRIFHWLNAAAIFTLIVTGIYIGNPFFSSIIHEDAEGFLMGWIRYIHFFAAFIFAFNLLVRLYWVFTGNKYATSNILRKVFWKDTWETIKFYLFMKNKKPHFVGHNPLAQLSYWIVIGGGSLIMILTGFFMYVEPRPESFGGKLFNWLNIFGDSYAIRSTHHLVTWVFIIFVVAHIYLSIREDLLEKNGTMSSIFTGYKTERKETIGKELENKLLQDDNVKDDSENVNER